jgi:hypothetical protein
LCKSTPLLMLARVMHDSITNEPTSKPWAHASRISSFGLVGFSTTFPRAITLGTGLIMVAEFSRIRALRAEEAWCDVTVEKVGTPLSAYCHDKQRNAEEREEDVYGEEQVWVRRQTGELGVLCPPPFLRISPCLLWTAGKKLMLRRRVTTQRRQRR